MASQKFTLSTAQPDYEQINEQLTAYLSSKESWASAGNSKTGTLLIEAISAVGAYDQYSVWAAVNETTLENAVLPQSIYCNNLFLGNRLTRVTPAQLQASVQNTDFSKTYIEVPRYTQFKIEGIDYFNREAIIFDSESMQQEVTLYQGSVRFQTFTSSGLSYQSYVLESDTAFSISDTDILCYVGNTAWERTTEALFTKSGDANVFYENSTQDGKVKILFGDGTYGAVPTANENLTFIYVVSNGASGNGTAVSQRVSSPDFVTLVGETLTNPSGGGDPLTIDYYKQLGSQSAASNGRAITRNDIKAIVCKFPGIIDCNVYCQAEIAPLDKDWMNVIGLLILTDETFNEYSWKNLVSYLQEVGIPGFQYKRFDAEQVSLDIQATFYLKKGASLTECQGKLETAIRQYMKLKVGCLGRSFYKSDLDDIAFSVLPTEIDYVEKASPAVNLILNKNQYIVLSNLSVSCKYSERDTQYWVNPIKT